MADKFRNYVEAKAWMDSYGVRIREGGADEHQESIEAYVPYVPDQELSRPAFFKRGLEGPARDRALRSAVVQACEDLRDANVEEMVKGLRARGWM
jgi:hypothetical protein